MTIRTSPWPDGVPCWAEITVPDVAAAKDFYRAVLGWSYRLTDIEFGGYAIAEIDGEPAAGIGPLPLGAPVSWRLFLAADDADEVAAAVPAHGGRVLMPPHDVGAMGRTFIARDPTGATFGVWQAGTHIGAGRVNEAGGLIWEDLRSPDPEGARAFYAGLFGHRTEPLPEAGPDYHVFSLPEAELPLGGIGGLVGEKETAHWLVYFAVADADAAAVSAGLAGGRVLDPPVDTGYGRIARLADPFGATFCVLQPRADDDPP